MRKLIQMLIGVIAMRVRESRARKNSILCSSIKNQVEVWEGMAEKERLWLLRRDVSYATRAAKRLIRNATETSRTATSRQVQS
jgi:hypothetical protein